MIKVSSRVSLKILLKKKNAKNVRGLRHDLSGCNCKLICRSIAYSRWRQGQQEFFIKLKGCFCSGPNGNAEVLEIIENMSKMLNCGT